MAHLSLSLLGTFLVQLDGEPVSGFQSNKVRALLAYLAVQSHQAHERARLAGLLWPEWTSVQAMTYLRHALANLHDILHDRDLEQPFIAATRRTIRFNPESDHSLDVLSLQQMLAAARSDASQPCQNTIMKLRDEVTEYRGDFMEGFFLDDCSAYEEWQLFTRERLRHQLAEALRLLARGYETLGDYVQAQEVAWQWIEREPWSDEAHRYVMRYLAMGGETSAAIAHYERFGRMVASELGTEPAEETKILAAQIKAGTAEAGPAGLTSPPGWDSSDGQSDRRLKWPPFLSVAPRSPRPPTLFVDREAELDTLDRHLARAYTGNGHIVFVKGEAGEGKTLLVQKFAQRALEMHPELVVATGSCDAYTGPADPYLPFRDLFGLLTGDLESRWAAGTLTRSFVTSLWSAYPTVLKHIIAQGPDLIGTLVPGRALQARASGAQVCTQRDLAELQRLVDRSTRSYAPTGIIRQVSLFDQATRVLQATAQAHPLLLVFDDLQWADQGSLGLLYHLSRRLTGCRILLLGTYRTEEVALGRGDEPHPLATVIEELRRAHENTVIDLGQADGEIFLRGLLSAEPNRLTSEFNRQVLQRSQGHALFTVELVDSLREGRGLIRDGEGFWVQTGDLLWDTLPTEVEAVIAKRIESLPTHLRSLLSVASVEGERFTAEVAADILGIDLQETVRQLSGDLGRKRRLVQAQGVGWANDRRVSRYQFRHILFQQYLYSSLDPVERAHIHHQVGLHLEELYATIEDSDVPAAQLALHFESAGLTEKALAYRIRAGEEAVRISAYQEALVHFQTGLDLLERSQGASGQLGQELALRSGTATALAALRGHGHTSVGESYARALELVQQATPTADSFLVQWGMWRYHHVRGDAQTADRLARQLIALSEDRPDPIHIAGAHHAMGVVRYAQGDFVQARLNLEIGCGVESEAVTSTYTKAHGENPQVSTRFFLANVLWLLGFPDQSENRLREAVELASKDGHPISQAFARTGAASVYVYRGSAMQAQRESAIAQAIAEKHNFDQVLAWNSFLGQWAANAQAPDPETVASMARSHLECIEAGMVVFGTRATAMLAKAYGSVGQVQKGLELLDEALAASERHDECLFLAENHRLRGELLLMRGVTGQGETTQTEAESCFLRAIDIARSQEAKSWELRATASLCRLRRSQGRVSESTRMLAGIFGWFQEGFDTPDLQESRILLAQLTGEADWAST